MSEPIPPIILNAPQDLHQLLFDVMRDGVLVTNCKSVIVDCNRAFYERLGYTREELIGRSVQAIDTPEFASRVPERVASIREHGEATFETAHLRKDGSVMPVEINARFCEIQGETFFFGIVRDLSERKRLQIDVEQGLAAYQAAVNTSDLGFWAVDANTTRLLDVNTAYEKQSGYARDELLGLCIADLDALEHPEEVAAHAREITEKGFARFRTLHRRKDGTTWPAEVVTSYSSVQGGRFFVFIEDISTKIESDRDQKLAARVLETIDQGVVVTDTDAVILSVNPATCRISGYDCEELLGQNTSLFSSGRHPPEFYAAMWRDLLESGHWEGEIMDRRKTGEVYPKWLSIHAIESAEGKVEQYVAIFADITERKKSEELIWRQANFDSLTGLANRIQFLDRLEQSIARCKRTHEGLAVLFMDLDGFKDVNDSLGHAVGDRLLVKVAQRLEMRARRTDLVARLGGDEFTLMVGSFNHPEQVASLAEEVLEALQEPVSLDGHSIRVGASIGIALYPDDGETPEMLTKHADTAMYQAKAAGKHTFKFFKPEMNLRATERLQMIHNLHQAVEQNAFEIFYQPKLRLTDQRVVGMEALIRWPRGGGMVSPAEFIPCAEETGLILPIGQWVLEEACRQTAAWNRELDTQLKIAVNLSARQFHSRDLLREIEQTLQVQGLPPKLLELEITESILMEDVEQAIEQMRQMRQAGMAIAIDDFGTGYSSLNYLKRFPITTLKVDQSFVRELDNGYEDAAITRSIITLANSLGLEVVAEGVERQAQADFLLERRCHLAQGYLFGRPMPAAAFRDYLLERRDRLI